MVAEVNKPQAPAIEEDGRYIIVDGRKYSPFGSTVGFQAKDFRVGYHLDGALGEKFTPVVQGTAVIREKGIEVLGSNSALSKLLTLSIRPDLPEQLKEYSELLVREIGISGNRLFDHSIPSRVSIGFIAGDWELDTQDEYYIEIGLCRTAFDQLVNLIEQGRAVEVGFSAQFWNLYADAEYAPVSFPRRIALKAARYSAEPARGELTGFGVHSPTGGASSAPESVQPQSSLGEKVRRSGQAESLEVPTDHLTRLEGAVGRMTQRLEWLAILAVIVIASNMLFRL